VSYKQRSETTGQVCVQSVRLNSPWYTRADGCATVWLPYQ